MEQNRAMIQDSAPSYVNIHRVALLTEIISPYRIPVFNALAKHEGIDLTVIFLAETDPVLRQWRVYKDEIRFSYQVLPSFRLRAGTSHLLLNAGLSASLKRISPEVVICGGYNYAASWQALMWARRCGVKFVLWSESNAQDIRSDRRPVEFLKAHFLKRCNRFVVPGKSAFEYLRSFGSTAESIFTAPNAVDSAWFAMHADTIKRDPTALRKKFDVPQRFLLYVGRLVPEKGVFDLLQAYVKLTPNLRSEVGLVFAGEGGARAALFEQAKQIEPGTIRFPGFVERDDLAGLYALAEACILPTHSDTWGLVVNEAMACGLPVIVTNVAGCARDLVEDAWNGYVVPPAIPERLSAAISSLLSRPEQAQAMGARSFERIQAYSPQACANGLASAALAPFRGSQ